MTSYKNAPILAGFAAIALMGASAAQADTAKDYNGFIIGGYTGQNSSTEGRLAVGGNASLSSYGTATQLGVPANGTDTLVVGGNLAYSNGQVFNGNVVVGGTTTGNVTVANGTQRTGAGPVDFNAEATRLRALSTQLSQQIATGTSGFQYGGLTFTGNESGLNVFNLSGAQLAMANSFSVVVPTGSFALFNISGVVDQASNFGMFLTNITASNILYNFYEATSLTINSVGVKGTVLAPLANVTFNNGSVQGTLIAASLNGQGNLINAGYAGTLLDPVTAVPETATWIMMILGFGMVGGALRARRHKLVIAPAQALLG